MRSQAATCLFESSGRSEAAVSRTGPRLKENERRPQLLRVTVHQHSAGNSNYIVQGETMHKRKLGSSNLEVSALGLGCMGMSFSYGPKGCHQ